MSGGVRILKAKGPAGVQRKLRDSRAGCLGQTQQQEVKCTLRRKTGHNVQNQVWFIGLQKEQFRGVQEARTGLECGLSADGRVHTTGLDSSVWGQVRAKAKLRSNGGIKAETPDRADGGQCYSWTLATNITGLLHPGLGRR